MRINWRDAMNIVSYTSIDNFKIFKKDKEYTGHELFSLIIPSKININRGGVEIKNGILKKGQLSKEFLGSKKKNALHQLIWDEYGVEETKDFMDNVNRLVNNFNLYNGFSVGIGDVDIPKSVEEEISNLFQTKDIKVNHMITEVENNPELMTEDLYERTIFAELNNVLEDVSKLIMNNLKVTNNFGLMINSGSKGEGRNMGQIAGCVGMQAFEGKLIPKIVNKRTLPFFFQNDDRGESRGLIKRPYVHGVSYPEFFFHNMTSRSGLIDSAVKSITGDTLIVIIENNKIKHIKIGDWIDEHIAKSPNEVKHFKERNLELLNLKEKVYIPTTDYNCNVTWGELTAVTRHDPGDVLYEIITDSGRKVIVTESKSLLIWNKDKCILEEIETPKIVIGDCVPVTMNLPRPPIVQDRIGQYFGLNEANGIMVGILLAKLTSNNYVSNYINNYERRWSECTIIIGIENILHDLTKNRTVPNEAFIGPIDFAKGILDGYISICGIIEDEIIIKFESLELLNGINMLCSRLGIYTTIIDETSFKINKQWIYIFRDNVSLTDIDKNNKLKQIRPLDGDDDNIVMKNIVLDKIISINIIDVKKYPKVYDVTVPSTFNFAIANGLQVRDQKGSLKTNIFC